MERDRINCLRTSKINDVKSIAIRICSHRIRLLVCICKNEYPVVMTLCVSWVSLFSLLYTCIDLGLAPLGEYVILLNFNAAS